MSVCLTSLNGKVADGISNATWLAIVRHARVYEGDKIPDWNGCHDGQEWTPEQLTLMANRLSQTSSLIGILRELANNGGVKIS